MHTNSTGQSAEGKVYSKPYSSGRAIAGGFFLSAMLWWIPVIGPAVAGYYAGRRSGSFINGILTSVVAGGILFTIITVASHYILGPTGFHDTLAESAFGALAGYLVWAEMYLEYFFAAGTIDVAMAPFGILVVFGGIGGSFSALHRREAVALMANGAVHSAIRPLARSVEMYERGRKLGFESFNECITIKDSVMSFNLSNSNERKDSDEWKMQTFHTSTVTSEAPMSTTSVTNGSKSHFSDILAQTEVHRDKKSKGKK